MWRKPSALIIVILAMGVLTIGVVTAIGATSTTTLDRSGVAQRLLRSPIARHLTAPALAALQMSANGTRQFGTSTNQVTGGDLPTGRPGAALGRSPLANVRVNDPAEDSHQVDQTTQSEPMVTVSGSNVAVGFNDSQTALLALTAGGDLTGYAYSTDGGASFTDGGALPNAPGFVNFGDPWLAHDRTGRMYFSNLALDGTTGNLDVGVGTSSDGGRTWSAPTPTLKPGSNVLYQADKDAIAVGRDPVDAGRDDVYVAWDDLSGDATGHVTLGLPVAHSTDGGTTWTVAYADQTRVSDDTCTFKQYIGAQPFVDAANGTLYVVAERIGAEDPTCVGVPATLSQWVFRSTDGGRTFSKGVQIAAVTPSFPSGALELGPGKLMRNAEFPAVAERGGTLYVAWNDGATGHSHIRLASSNDGGHTWALRWVTQGAGTELQPAISADTALHILYYQANANRTLDTIVADSSDGTSFTTERVTTQSFPGVFTAPQFDPILAPAYMGDYIGNVSDGRHQYFVWGDNRDKVTNFLWPAGRQDPNVYLAKR